MNHFFAPVSYPLYTHLLDFDRLYSFPKIPEITANSKVIIDSGAYGLFSQNREFNKPLIHSLSEHHDKYCIDSNYLLVAPDVPKNMYKTMLFFDTYKSISNNAICPVFHFSKGYFDLFEFRKQYEFYKTRSDFKFVFFSEKNMREPVSVNISKYDAMLRYVRGYLPKDCVIHFFSSGKSLFDIERFFQHDNVSLDTSNFQYDAKSVQEMSVRYNLHYSDNYVDNCKNILNKINSLKLWK